MTLIRRISTLGAVGLLGAAALLAGCATPAHKAATDAEYLLTVTRPGLLHVIDMKTDRIARSCEVPGKFGSGALVPSPDGRHAFVLGNLWEDVYGFDMTDGAGNIDPADAAAQLCDRIDALTPDTTGTFWHANGQVLPW